MVRISRNDDNNPTGDGAALHPRPSAADALHDDSESEVDIDEVADVNDGYVLLPQSVGSESESDGDHNDNVGDSGDNPDDTLEFPASLNRGGCYVMELSQPPHEWRPSESDLQPQQSRDLQLDDEKIAKIKNAMKGISLPATARPAWAAHISEAEWGTRLQELVARTKCDSVQDEASS